MADDLFPDLLESPPKGREYFNPKLHVRGEGPDTSREAAHTAELLAENHMRIIYAELAQHEEGLTVQQIETNLLDTDESLSQQQVCRRMIDLTRAGRIHDCGERRKNRSGRKAIVWKIGKGPVV